MRKRTRLSFAATIGALCMSSQGPMAQNESGGTPELPPARAIPGITTEDQFPRACVDCHINYTDMNLDTRFGTVMAQWSKEVDPALLEIAREVAGPGVKLIGVHPRVDAALNDIPAACFSCHQSDANGVVPLVPLLHRVHLAGESKAVFLRVFQGECTHCHKLDRTTGQWRVPSAPEG